MKRAEAIYQKDEHAWYVFARDPSRPGHLIDTNEYLVTEDGHGLLVDPGGSEIFPAVFSALAEVFDPSRIQGLFASHQDPDIASSLGLWLEFKPELRCYISWMWAGFLPHFGGRAETFVPLPDEGADVPLGRLRLKAVPAHYLHSSGNFHLYDPEARILFSGDVGAALLPPESQGLFVEDFDRHIRNAEGFHKRWMGSNEAKHKWCERVSGMQVDMLCPQHGAIYQGADVGRFLDWFDGLQVGI